MQRRLSRKYKRLAQLNVQSSSRKLRRSGLPSPERRPDEAGTHENLAPVQLMNRCSRPTGALHLRGDLVEQLQRGDDIAATRRDKA